MADLIEREPLLAKMWPNGNKRLVEEAPAVNRWISVEDALPDGNRSVLVQHRVIYNNTERKEYAVAFYGKFTKKWIEPISGEHLEVLKWRDIENGAE